MNLARTRQRKRASKTVASFALCAALALSLWACGPDTKGQTEETFGEAFYVSSLVHDGVLQSDYVNESAYSMTSYVCSNIRAGENGTVNADVEATIENDSFQTSLKATGIYSEDGGYRFNLTESKTTPKKGIDFDRENGLENFESELSQELNGPVCTAWKNPPEGAWFLEREAQGEYTFTDGVGWECTSFDNKPVFNKELEGSYTRIPRKTESDGFIYDDGSHFITNYVISNFDPDSLTFDVEYSVTGNFDRKETVSGKATAKLEPQQFSTAGLAYTFKTEGTSDEGNGTAIVSGELAASEDGSKTITAHILASGNGPEGKSKNWPCSTPDETMVKQ